MATGLLGSYDGYHVIRILEAATATNSPPATYAGAGVDIGAIFDSLYGGAGRPSEGHLVTHTSAGSGTMTATMKAWAGYLGLGTSGAGKYVAAGPGAAATAGVRNGGAAFDEHASDVIARTETVYFDKVTPRKWYEEVTAIGGTSTAITVDLLVPLVLR